MSNMSFYDYLGLADEQSAMGVLYSWLSKGRFSPNPDLKEYRKWIIDRGATPRAIQILESAYKEYEEALSE